MIVLSLRFDLVTLQRQFRELDSMSERPLEAFRTNVRLFDSLFLMFAFKGSDAIICFRSGGRGSAQRCAQPETGPEDAG